ncbi:phosphate uptake regulator PhoU [Sulfolobus tengchongensis]|uniref:Phosphate uptake regulator PhoU n=1 Tax=Sulfolobus tengchongensis TaxID=207809 RepID=A0AAX4L3W1_9CREN
MEKNLRRRIQKIKGGSYIITLPPEWIRRNNLDAKSEVLVIQKDGELLIKPIRKYSSKKIINLDEVDIETVKYLINVYYMQGISEIEIISQSVISTIIKNELKTLQLYLQGLIVENESFNYIRFRIHDNAYINLIEEMKNFANKLEILLEDLYRIAENPVKEMAIDLKNRSEELYKLYNLLIREIALISQKEEEFDIKNLPTKDLILYAIAMRDMGRMLSHIKTASSVISECKSIPSETVIAIQKVIRMFKEAREVFFDQNMEYIRNIRDSMKEINKLASSTEIECKELAREVIRIGSYCIALMDDGVHKSVKL